MDICAVVWPPSTTSTFSQLSKLTTDDCSTASGKQYLHSLQMSLFLCSDCSISSILKHSGQKFICYFQVGLIWVIMQEIITILFAYLCTMDSSKGEVQELCDYVNNILGPYEPAAELLPINPENWVESLHDGVLLCYVVNCLSPNGQVIKQSELKKSKATLFHKMDQVNKALDAAKKVGLNIVNIRAEFIVEKKENTILGLFNQIKRQRPGAKTQARKSQPIKTQSPPTQNNAIVQEQTPIEKHQKQPKDKGDFVLQQSSRPQQSTLKQNVPQPPPQPVHTQNPKQRVAKMVINQNQVISKQALSTGYHFENVQGNQILVLCGSLRKNSVNHEMIKRLQEIKSRNFFDNIHFHIPDLGILPLLNNDLVKQSRIPQAVKSLVQIASRSQGILIATPEYNGSFSGIIKNAFDWLSIGSPNPLEGKKIGIISASYLTQNQIRDTIEMGQTHKCVFFQSFYINLRSGAFNMESGVLQSAHQIDKLALWYQDFSHFVLSKDQFPEPLPRFIMNP